MNEHDVLAERFEAHRPRLRALAYQTLGSTTEADDAVQETWLRLSRSDSGAIENLGALGRGRQAPALESLLRGVDGQIHVLSARRREHADELRRVRGVAIFDGFAAARGNPFSVDVILKDFWCSSSSHAKSSRLSAI